MPSTLSKNILMEDGKAVGVTVRGLDGKDYNFCAKHEVVVSQGVFEFPKLFLLSDIDPRA